VARTVLVFGSCRRGLVTSLRLPRVTRTMTAVDSRVAVPSEDDLARLLQIGVVIEEYAEEKSARLLSDEVEDEEVRETLDEALTESDEHRRRLLSLVREVGEDVDEERVESLVRESVESNVPSPDDPDEALRHQLESERLAGSYYDSVIETCRASTRIDDATVGRIVETLEEIRDDEYEDAEKIQKELTKT
jgi:rubrerythrin